jgi:hypothetical protein
LNPITVSQTVRATPLLVFETVANPEAYARAVPVIVRTDFLSESRRGAGTRFRSVRAWKGRESTTELEITEAVPSRHIRMVTESGGIVWDTTYTITPAHEGVVLTIAMNAHTNHLGRRVLIFLIRRMMSAALRHDLQALKTFCEASDPR